MGGSFNGGGLDAGVPNVRHLRGSCEGLPPLSSRLSILWWCVWFPSAWGVSLAVPSLLCVHVCVHLCGYGCVSVCECVCVSVCKTGMSVCLFVCLSVLSGHGTGRWMHLQSTVCVYLCLWPPTHCFQCSHLGVCDLVCWSLMAMCPGFPTTPGGLLILSRPVQVSTDQLPATCGALLVTCGATETRTRRADAEGCCCRRSGPQCGCPPL